MTVRRLLWILLTILAAILFLLVAKTDGPITAGTRQPDLVSLTVKIALAVFVGAIVLTLLRERFSRALETAMVWVAVALLLAVGYGFRTELRDVSERLMADYMPSRLAPRNRVVEINPGQGVKFDPHQHQAISVVPAPGQEPNTVVTVLQKGFLIADRVLRPALVTVSAPK